MLEKTRQAKGIQNPMKNIKKKQAVAIVGRPNVGKSCIFNRLGRRMAIVHSERGVTRDRIVQETEWQDKRFDLIDTGGLGALDAMESGERAGQMETLVKRQIAAAVEDADVVILVTDISAGLIPQDEDAAEFLRRTGKPVFLAANKADNPERDAGASDFFRLGFPVFPVSALHYRGFGPLMDAVVARLPEGRRDTGPKESIRIAVVGHPNVGKSSFVNRLLGCERVIVSDLPGTTRDSIDISFSIGAGADERHYTLTDTAGIRRARKIRGALDHFSIKSAERGIERSDVVALMLDAAQGPTAQDKKIASLVLDYRKGCVILVNKWDLNTEATAAQYYKALRAALPFLGFVPVLNVSAKTGFNISRALETLETVAAHSSAKLATGALNRVIKLAYEKKQPPLIRGRRLKVYYATQVGIRPITIAMFVNSAGRPDADYETYLANTLRRAFGLEGVPIMFKFKSKTRVQKKR